MLESIIADDMMSHLKPNKLILDSQHGFRSGRSCLTNLVDFFHMFSIYDKSRAVDILYLENAGCYVPAAAMYRLLCTTALAYMYHCRAAMY